MKAAPVRKVDFAEFMSTIRADIQAKQHYRKVPSLSGGDSAIPEGGRNAALTSFAGTMQRCGMSPEAVEAALQQENIVRCDPPLDTEEVRRIAASIGRYEPGGKIKHVQRLIGKATPLFSADTYRAARLIDTQPSEQKWILNNFLPANIVGLVVAPGGTGKSWLLAQLAASAVTGLPFAGIYEVGTTGSVLLLSAEDDEAQLHRRIKRLLEQLGGEITPALLALLRQKLFIVPRVGEDNLLTSTDPDTREVGMTLLLERLIAAAKQIPDLALIIIDPASRFRGGNENAAEDVTRFIEALERIARATGATVLVAHHANKGAYQATEQNQSASRGSSALTDGARWQLNLMTFSEKEAQKYGVPVEEKGFYLTAAITKNNYSAPQPPVILKRGEGGYLHRADLVSTKVVRGNTLSNQIMALVALELKDGRTHSKSAFANQFGGKDRVLKVGNNTVRDTVSALISAGRLQVISGKLAVTQQAKLPKSRGAT